MLKYLHHGGGGPWAIFRLPLLNLKTTPKDVILSKSFVAALNARQKGVVPNGREKRGFAIAEPPLVALGERDRRDREIHLSLLVKESGVWKNWNLEGIDLVGNHTDRFEVWGL